MPPKTDERKFYRLLASSLGGFWTRIESSAAIGCTDVLMVRKDRIVPIELKVTHAVMDYARDKPLGITVRVSQRAWMTQTKMHGGHPVLAVLATRTRDMLLIPWNNSFNNDDSDINLMGWPKLSRYYNAKRIGAGVNHQDLNTAFDAFIEELHK